MKLIERIKKKTVFLSIRNKLIILFFVIALLPVILGYITLLVYQKSIKEQVRASHFAMEESLVKLVDQYVVDCQKVIIDASYQQTIIDGVAYWNLPKLRNRFSSVHKRYKNFTFILAEDRNGVVKVSYPQNSGIIGKKFSPKVNLSIKKPGISDVFCSNYIRELAVVVVYAPVKNSAGRIIGTLIGGIDIKTLSSMLDKVKPDKDSYIYIVDRKGVILSHPDESMLLTDLSEESSMVKKVIQDKTGVESVMDYRGTKMLAAYKLTPLSKWGVVFQEPFRNAYANLIRLKIFFIILTLVGLAVALYFSIRFSSMITAPIHDLQHGAEMIGAGNLNYRLNIKTRDEIEKLAKEFNSMAEKLNESYSGFDEKINSATRDLKEAHKEIEDKNLKLKESDRLKSEFLANMSHELRTPMNAIIGFSSLMEERIYGEISAKQEDALGKIGKNAKALLQLINDILDLSRIEAGKVVMSPSEFKLTQLVDEIVVTMEPLIRPKSFELTRNIDERTPELFTDRNRLKQIIINLLTNSIKFTKEGRIAIDARVVDPGDKVEISVEDTGIGIHENDLPYMFEEFRQADGSSTRQYGGTGLGLSITKKLLDLLGGEIEAQSVYGKGTKMVFRIPVKMEETEKV